MRVIASPYSMLIRLIMMLVLVTTQNRIGQSDAFTPLQQLTAVAPSYRSSSTLVHHGPTNINSKQRRCTSLALHGIVPAGILTSTFETISAFSKSSLSSAAAAAAAGGGSGGAIVTTTAAAAAAASQQQLLLQSMMQRALATPPVAYFLALMAAGCGVPVSEDALCVFVGAVVWPFLQSQDKRRNLLLALYLGVVVSDWVTFWIGRMMRSGILAPLAKKLNLNGGSGSSNDTAVVVLQQSNNDNTETSTATSPPPTAPKTAFQQRFLKRAGRWAGFVIRFSVGTRGPLMLMTGFSKQVPFIPFALGASVGALVTVPLQLYVGYALSTRGGSALNQHHHPPTEASAAAALAVVAGISTFVLGAAIVLTTATVGSLVVSQIASKRNQRRQQRLLSKPTNNTINTAM